MQQQWKEQLQRTYQQIQKENSFFNQIKKILAIKVLAKQHKVSKPLGVLYNKIPILLSKYEIFTNLNYTHFRFDVFRKSQEIQVTKDMHSIINISKRSPFRTALLRPNLNSQRIYCINFSLKASTEVKIGICAHDY